MRSRILNTPNFDESELLGSAAVRELLLNTCKHGGVDSVEVTIGHADEQLNIQVRDIK